MTKTILMHRYTIMVNGTAQKGDPKTLLKEIYETGREANKEIQNMSFEEYVDALISDAVYFVPDTLLQNFKKQEFHSKYEQALTYLAASPTSSVKILSIRE